MEQERILILDRQQINRKLQRMAYEIWEHNSNEQGIVLIGIESGGVAVAQNLAARLEKISPLKVEQRSLKLNKKQPLKDAIQVTADLSGKAVVLADDVANSGKTLLYALKPLLDQEPSKIMVAVLVDRKHKSFPITPDIVGHSISTTLQEHILVECHADGSMEAFLE
jgi:pyrimidine operon attenuation protein/uracil phosphoribosyltransferase